MKSQKTTQTTQHAKLHLMISVRLALFGASLLPISALAQQMDAPQDNIAQKNTSLERLASHYQKVNTQARCQGVWVQPSPSPLTQKNIDETRQDKASTNGYYAQADYGYYDNDSHAELSGNVILEQNGQQVLADKITFNPKTGESNATGQVLFADGNHNSNDNDNADGTQQTHATKGAGMIGVAEQLQYNANNQTATAKDVAFASTTINAHGHAKQMQKVNDSQYKLDEVMFSTCPPTERKWHLDADSITLDTDTGRGIAKNSTLKIKDIPVFYLPYFNFPIDDRRASGFLLPTAGLNATDGLEVSAPYYLNLAANFDATITPTIFSNKNPMLGAEFRYLTANYGSGILDAAYLPDDKKRQGQNRHHLFFDHSWHAKNIENLSAYATYRSVSDSNYLSDFDTLGVASNPLNLPRRLGVNYYNDHLTADLRMETFQTLSGTIDNSPILDKDKPYSRLPQLAVHYTLPKSSHALGQKLHIPSITDRLDITGIHNTAYFKKPIKDNSETEKSGVRMYNQLSASYPLLRSWGYFTPKLSLHHLYASYNEDSLAAQNLSKANGSYAIFAPQISLDTAVFFEKSGSPFGWFNHLGGYQVLSPRLKYNRTPYKDQSQLPNFETAYSAISYNQLLSDSWFLGHDRIQDMHAITPAISYRYIDKDGLTRFDGGVAGQFYLDDFKVGLNNNQIYNRNSSGLAWQANLQPFNHLWVDSDGSFTPNHAVNHINAQLRYQPNAHSLYSIGIINRKENQAFGQLPLHAYTAAAVFPVNNRWRLLAQVQYDHRNDRLLDGLIGINYEDCCYGLSVYARHYRNSLNTQAKANNAIMVELRFNGITSTGRMNKLMSNKVLGYDEVQHAWRNAD